MEWSESQLYNLQEKERSFTVEIPLPGVSANRIQVQMDNDVLTVQAEVMYTRLSGDPEQVQIRDRHFSTFMQCVQLPAPVDAERADAVYDRGILKVTLPKAPGKRFVLDEASHDTQISVHDAHAFKIVEGFKHFKKSLGNRLHKN